LRLVGQFRGQVAPWPVGDQYKDAPMAPITIEHLSETAQRLLNMRAAAHGQSTEEEICAILEDVLKRPEEQIKMGSALAAIGRRHGLSDEDLEFDRDRSPGTPFDLE
jgi:plasmid stability protein